MRKLVVLVLITSSSLFARADINLDSLYAIWKNEHKSNTIRLEAYKDYIINGFMYSNPDSAFQLAQELIQFGKENKYEDARGTGFLLQGASFQMRSDYSQSINYLEKSLSIFKQLDDHQAMAVCILNIGGVHTLTGNYTEALRYLKLALSEFEKLGAENNTAVALMNIGAIFQLQGNFKESIRFYTRSLKITKKLGDKRSAAIALKNIGILYFEMGDVQKALTYYKRVLETSEELGDKKGIADAQCEIGTYHKSLNNYKEALHYFNKSLEINKRIDNPRGIASVLKNLGEIYQSQGDFAKSFSYLEQSLEIQEKIGDKEASSATMISIGHNYQKQLNHSKAIQLCKIGYEQGLELKSLVLQESACQCLYDSYKLSGMTNEALEYLELMRSTEQKINENEVSKKLQQMEFAAQLVEDSIAVSDKERQVKQTHQREVKKKNQMRNLLLLIALFLLVFLGGIYARLRYVRRMKAKVEREKVRSDNLLLNILPADIAEELKEKGRADARDYNDVSILFTDFKDFTSISEKLSPKDLLAEINACFHAFDGIIEKYKIEKIKTIGDAYMAASGFPISTVDSVKNSILAALEMQAFIIQRKIINDAANKPAFQMRIGIHTGPIVAGIVGVKKFSYDVWGDTVNIASRMESNSEVEQVNISSLTYERIKDDPEFVFENRGKIRVKGKGELVMYFVRKNDSKKDEAIFAV